MTLQIHKRDALKAPGGKVNGITKLCLPSQILKVVIRLFI